LNPVGTHRGPTHRRSARKQRYLEPVMYSARNVGRNQINAGALDNVGGDFRAALRFGHDDALKSGCQD